MTIFFPFLPKFWPLSSPLLSLLLLLPFYLQIMERKFKGIMKIKGLFKLEDILSFEHILLNLMIHS